MEVSLPPGLKRFVKEKVKEGMYSSESDVICDALRRRVKGCTSYRVSALKSQLAHVEIAIREILIELERVRLQEDEESDRMKQTQEKAEAILSNLRKAAEAYAEIINATQL